MLDIYHANNVSCPHNKYSVENHNFDLCDKFWSELNYGASNEYVLRKQTGEVIPSEWILDLEMLFPTYDLGYLEWCMNCELATNDFIHLGF